MESIIYFFETTASVIPWRILIVLLAALLLHRIIRVVVRRVIHRIVMRSDALKPADERQPVADLEKREETIGGIFATALIVIMWLITILIILSELGVNIAAMATGAGLAGIIIGFGAQNVVKDYLAGIFIILEDQYRVGDIVMFEGTGSLEPLSGTVEQITIRMTRLRDLDGNVHVVLNSAPTSVTNMSYKFANTNIDIAVPYDADIDAIETIINQVGTKLAKDFSHETLEPIQFLRVNAFEDRAVIVKCLGKTKPADQWTVAGEFRRRIKKAFEAENIAMPLDRLVVESRTAPKSPAKKK